MIKQINFNDHKNQLTEADIDQIVAIVTAHCRHRAKQRVRSILTYGPNMINCYGILSRLIKENGTWRYVSGQSYTDEIRVVRQCILGEI